MRLERVVTSVVEKFLFFNKRPTLKQGYPGIITGTRWDENDNLRTQDLTGIFKHTHLMLFTTEVMDSSDVWKYMATEVSPACVPLISPLSDFQLNYIFNKLLWLENLFI